MTTALVDTNIVVRHLTGDPPAQAHQATALIAGADRLLLPDLIVAETVYVLESAYRQSRSAVALLVRSLLAVPSVRVLNRRTLERAVDLYELDRLDFPEAYLVAVAEAASVDEIASFDRALDRVSTVRRIEP